MKKHKIEFDKITEAQQKVELAAATAADYEAKIVIAERAVEDARRDDGVSAPLDIYNRAENARRELEVLKIEGNRAAAKLTEAEEEFAVIVRGAAPQIAEHLCDVANAARQRITAAVMPLIGEASCKKPAFEEILRGIAEISEPSALAQRIRTSSDMDNARIQHRNASIELRGDLVSNIMCAARFF